MHQWDVFLSLSLFLGGKCHVVLLGNSGLVFIKIKFLVSIQIERNVMKFIKCSVYATIYFIYVLTKSGYLLRTATL